jgi:GPH family glycoside/pentoside/hexuronide:cation symporter
MSTLRTQTKFAYGIGQIGEQVKNQGFNTFLFFYFTQVLGLSGSLAGTAILVALIFDAVTDPLAGSLSDNSKSSKGRRHPFMYAAAAPLGIGFVILFNPPASFGQTGLFLWLTGFAILVRGAMTLYHVPHLALGAELSDDYSERTRVVAFRVFFGFLGAASIFAVARSVFMAPTLAFPEGQLNPAAYPPLGLFFGVAMGLLILASALGTHSRIPYLPQPGAAAERFSLSRLWRDAAAALRNASFRSFFAGIFLFFVARGIDGGLGLYMGTFFWKLGSEAVVLPVAGLVGILVGTPVFATLARRMDKKPMFMLGIIGFSFFTTIPPVAKLIGAFPPEASGAYVPTLYGLYFIASVFGAASLVSSGSMLADIADEHELETGLRQEGIFFGAVSFSGKASSGLGTAIAGFALWAIQFPTQAEVAAVPAAVSNQLAMIYGPGVLLLVIASIVILSRYSLDRARHDEIRDALARRGASGSTSR